MLSAVLWFQNGPITKTAETQFSSHLKPKIQFSHRSSIQQFEFIKIKHFKLNVLKLFYKYRNNTLPFYFSYMFSDYVISHSYAKRATYILDAPSPNTQWR